MATSEFDIFRGLVVNDFCFRGVDEDNGVTFEHSCGFTVRIGPNACISRIADMIKKHDCEKDNV